MENPSNSVLSQVDAKAIEDLVEMNPTELTDTQMDQIIDYTRAHRAAWEKEEKNPSGEGGGKKRKLQIDLDTLDIQV